MIILLIKKIFSIFYSSWIIQGFWNMSRFEESYLYTQHFGVPWYFHFYSSDISVTQLMCSFNLSALGGVAVVYCNCDNIVAFIENRVCMTQRLALSVLAYRCVPNRNGLWPPSSFPGTSVCVSPCFLLTLTANVTLVDCILAITPVSILSLTECFLSARDLGLSPLFVVSTSVVPCGQGLFPV